MHKTLVATASQLFQVASQGADQRGLLWKAKDLEVRLKLAKNLKPMLELPQQLCYFIFVLIQDQWRSQPKRFGGPKCLNLGE